MRKTWNREVSGDVQYALKPYWMFGSSTNIATHGSPYPYDTGVPILMSVSYTHLTLPTTICSV